MIQKKIVHAKHNTRDKMKSESDRNEKIYKTGPKNSLNSLAPGLLFVRALIDEAAGTCGEADNGFCE